MAARQNTRKLAWIPRTSLAHKDDEAVAEFLEIAPSVVPELREDVERLRQEVAELHHGKLPPSKKKFINRVQFLSNDLVGKLGAPGASGTGHRHTRADQSYAELLMLYSMLGDPRFILYHHLSWIQDSKRTADFGRVLGAPDEDQWWQMVKAGDIVGLFGVTFTISDVRPELKGFYEKMRFDEFSL